MFDRLTQSAYERSVGTVKQATRPMRHNAREKFPREMLSCISNLTCSQATGVPILNKPFCVRQPILASLVMSDSQADL